MQRATAFILSSSLALSLVACKADPGKVDPSIASNTTTQPTRMETPSASEPPAPPATKDTRPLILCFGDSLTAGYGIDDPSRTYPANLQRLLDQDGYAYRVVNAGVSGNTTKDGLDRLPSILARHPQIVVLEFGGNDGLRGLPLEQTQANMAAMIQQLQKAGVTVALAGITLPPDYGPQYITRFNAIYTTLARRFHTPLLPMLLVNVYNVPGSMQEDGTHPTAQGAETVAANVERLLKPLLHK